MARLNVDNGESGLVVRNKINDNFTEIYLNNDYVNNMKGNITIGEYSGPYYRIQQFTVSSWGFQTGDEGYSFERMGIVLNAMIDPVGGASYSKAPCIDIYNQNSATGATQLNPFIKFFNNTPTQIGSITRNSTNTGVAYNTTSDYRLKTNIEPLTGAVERLLQIPVHRFNWVVDPDGEKVDGFLAHEAQVIVPESVTGTKDAEKTEEYEVTPAVRDGNGKIVTPAVMGTHTVPDYQGIDQSKLVPLLVAAVQELTARVAALENK